MPPERIAIVGSGLMGHGIAQVFGARGHTVVVIDPDAHSLNTVKDRVRANLTLLIKRGVEMGEARDTILNRIQLTTDMEAGCQGAKFVFEAVFENMSLKQEVFAQLDRLCPMETVLCSNTSVMSITEIASKSQHRERIIGTHWWNPPYLIPLVEVIRTEQAAPWCLEAAYDLLQRAGKRPVHVNRDVPGFVGNRLQHALWREAFHLIDEGICDAATVDEVVRNGFGLRLPVLGPVANADLIGLDLTRDIHAYILPHLSTSGSPSTTMLKHIEQGQLGFKAGQGFLPWSESEIAATRERLMDHLIKALSQSTARTEGREQHGH
jgi:3-hydroxybutyryl-CoA dehydrogenase